MRTKLLGLAILLIGLFLVYWGLYSSDSLFLLQGAALHFFDHMQMLWSQMVQLARIYLVAGAVCLLLGLILLFTPSKKKGGHSHEFI